MQKESKKVYKVAFQGEKGAYSEEAAILYFTSLNAEIETIGLPSFGEVFEALDKGKVDYAIVPVENSLEGTVGQVYDLFLKYDLRPCGEIYHRIRHCLISFANETLKTIKRVYSHPQALGQCKKFIEENKLEAIPVYDTAGSVKMIKEKKLEHCAGIASERAAKIYGMKVIKKGIETNPNNYTRFLILCKKNAKMEELMRLKGETGKYKTSLIFSTKHVPGALFKVLEGFAKRNINLTKIESRPIIGKPWEYNFILDFEGHKDEPRVAQAIEDLKKNSTFFKMIGSYPKAEFEMQKTKKTKKEKKEMIKRVAIIGGGGGMGRWFAKFFSQNNIKVVISDIDKKKLEAVAKELNVDKAKNNIEAIKNADFILISVLPSDFENVVKEISKHVKKNQVVVDICSIKEIPVEIMHKYLECVTLGTHPMFGPGSLGIREKFVLTPTNKRERAFAKKFGKWLESKGFEVKIVSPKLHDELMSIILCIPHFVGLSTGDALVAIEKNISKLEEIEGTSFRILSSLVKNVVCSNPSLYSQIQFYLKQTEKAESLLEEKIKKWREIIKSKNEKRFVNEMKKLQKAFRCFTK
jgi:prephenate dehydratase